MSVITTVELIGAPAMEVFSSDYDLNELLNSELDKSADYWNLDQDGLASYAEKFTRLYAIANGSFTFQAVWQGSEIDETVELTFTEFLDRVKCNRIGKKTKYVVVGGAFS